MKPEFELDLAQLRDEVIEFAERFGDTSRQAVARASVSVAREAAVQTLPRGGDKGHATKKKIQARINRGVRDASIVLKSKRTFDRLRKQKRPRLKDGATWHYVRAEQWLDTREQLSDWIDRLRAGGANVPARLRFHEKAVVTATVVKKTQTLRRKLAGIAKGGWLGAGMTAAKFQKGGDRIAIGKNFMSWAQKHSRWGNAKWYGGRRSDIFGIELSNVNPYLPNLWHLRQARLATEIGWNKTLKHYERLLLKAEKKAGGA